MSAGDSQADDPKGFASVVIGLVWPIAQEVDGVQRAPVEMEQEAMAQVEAAVGQMLPLLPAGTRVVPAGGAMVPLLEAQIEVHQDIAREQRQARAARMN